MEVFVHGYTSKISAVKLMDILSHCIIIKTYFKIVYKQSQFWKLILSGYWLNKDYFRQNSKS